MIGYINILDITYQNNYYYKLYSFIILKSMIV